MKKLRLIIFSFIMVFVFIPSIWANENVIIKSIELDNSSLNGKEISKPTINGFDVNVDVELKEAGDYVKYKLVIENKDEKDYFLKEDTPFSKSNYISYKYYTNGKIKAKSDNVIYLVVTYNNEVEESLLVNKRYNESNKAVLEITDDTGQIIKNPKTGNDNITFIILSVLLIISCTVLFTMKKNNINKTTFMFIMILINCIPLIVGAVEIFKVNLNINVLINKEGFHVFYSPYFDHTRLFEASILDDYEIVSEECNLIYLNNQKDKPDLVNCNSVTIFKSKKEYFKGNVVDLLIWERYEYYNNNVSQSLKTCTKENNKLYCSFSKDELVSEKDSFDRWWYAKYSNPSLGYTYFEDDDLTMEFSNIDKQYGNWSSGYVIINLPSTFKMPEHSVYFSYALSQ